MKRVWILLLVILSGCKTVVSPEEVAAIAKDIDRNVSVYISGVPNKENTRELILEADGSDNLQLGVSMGVGYSSDGHAVPIATPSSSVRGDVYNYGSRQGFFEVLKYTFGDFAKSESFDFSSDFLPAKPNEVIINITFLESSMVSNDADKSISFAIGAGEENASGAIGGTWADRTNCRSVQEIRVQFIEYGKISQPVRVYNSGQLIKIKNKNSAKQAYIHTSEQVSREVVYELFRYLNGTNK